MIQDPLKEDAITNYIKSINFDGNFNVEQIQNDLKLMLGESPAVKIEWGADQVINEISGANEGRIEKVRSVKVFYTNYKGEVKKVEYYI
jgi:hypothetical protein